MKSNECPIANNEFIVFGWWRICRSYRFLVALLTRDNETVLTDRREFAEGNLPNTTNTQTVMPNDICFLPSDLLNLINLFREGMRTISIELDKNQFIRILNKLDDSDKLEIFNELKKSLFLKRFNKLLKSTRTNELTLDEITKEVESVRKQRYEKKSQEI